LGANALRARRTLLVELVRTSDRILTLLSALEAAQFPAISPAEAAVVGLLLKLLETGLVALRVLCRLLRTLQLADLASLGAAQMTAPGLQLLEATLSLARSLAGDRVVSARR